MVKSLRRFHPDLAVYVLFIDDIEGFVDPAEEGFAVLSLADLELPRPREFCFRYEVMELSTAVKPFLLRCLLDRGHRELLYLDPDIWVFRPLDALFEWLGDADLLLTPHLTGALADGHHPDERAILLSGSYNLGFVGIARGAQIDTLLAWWSERCELHCLSDVARGLFVDQRWMDLAPAFVDRVRIVRHPGYNAAYWNLAQRPLSGDPHSPWAAGEPLHFYHWSGFDPLKPTALSRHEDRYPVIRTEPLLSMAREYTGELLTAGYRVSSRWPYSLGVLRDGHPIAKELRDVFRDQPPGRFPDPFEPAGEQSFLSFAITPPSDGRLAPLVERLHRAWTQLDHSGRWRQTLPARALRMLATKVLDPLREKLSRDAALPPLAGGVLKHRPDVRKVFATPDGGTDRLRFLRWLAADGGAHHQLKPAWCARWLEQAEGPGVMPRLVELYDSEPGLQARFPMAFVEEHDAPFFLAWLEAQGAARGFTASVMPQVRRLFGARPAASIRAIYAGRPDVVEAYPDALSWPPDPGFLAWLRNSGGKEHGLREDWVRWFERSTAQHACLQIDTLYRQSADWQALHPLGATSFGRASLLDWLKGSGGIGLGLDLRTLERLCPVAAATPLDELRLLHDRAPKVRARFPRAFEDAGEMEGLLARVHELAGELGLDQEWLERLAREASGLCLRRGATIVGYLRTESGMGELSRSTARALREVRYPLTTVDIADAPQRQFDLSLVPEDHGPALSFTIVHANAPEALGHVARLAPWLTGRYAIGYWAWELSELPPDWVHAFALFREVWTCSTYAAAAIGRRAPVPTQTMWPALTDAPPSSRGRRAFGLPEDRFTLLFMCDLLSEMERKNPLGLLRAFRSAFRGDDRVQLVIKAANGDLRREDRRRLTDAASGLPVTIMDSHLSRPDVQALIVACDAYVSLHRAEGFGYTLAEAMALERPVVATYYSGNVDFMTPWNSFPVPYELVEMPEDRGRYRKGSVWAEPDLEAAANQLRTVFRDREGAALVAKRGREDVERQLSSRACGERILARLNALSAGTASKSQSLDREGAAERQLR
jgi:glycosyltransferase involved in cell wall biosynthesis